MFKVLFLPFLDPEEKNLISYSLRNNGKIGRSINLNNNSLFLITQEYYIERVNSFVLSTIACSRYKITHLRTRKQFRLMDTSDLNNIIDELYH